MKEYLLFSIIVIGFYLLIGCKKSIKDKEAVLAIEVNLSNFEGPWKCVSILKEGGDYRELYSAGMIQGINENSPIMEVFIREDHSFTLRSKHHEIVTIYKGYIEMTSQHAVVAHKVLGPIVDVKNTNGVSDTWEMKLLTIIFM